MANKTASQNVVAIDILRAAAALGVFYYHSHIGATLAKYTGLSMFTNTEAFGADYSVPLFFLISGYCILISNIKYIKTNSRLPLMQYYRRRFLRIYPPYLVAMLFALAVNYITIENYALNSSDLLIHLFSLQGFTAPYFNTINVVLWTISIELAFYAIYPIFYYIRFRYSLNYALVFTLGITCLSIAYYTFKGDIGLPQRFCVFNLWFAWCCGAFLADKKTLNAGALNHYKYLLVYAVILAAFIYLKYEPNTLFIIADQLKILIWTAPMLLILSQENWLIKRKSSWIIKAFTTVGISSYSLYLLHEPLINLKNFLVHKYIPGQFQQAGVAMGIFLIPIIAWFSYKYVEKPFITKKRRMQIIGGLANS
jgi:peptidoglycan/LPS O-acetylase OafA/YrhL